MGQSWVDVYVENPAANPPMPARRLLRVYGPPPVDGHAYSRFSTIKVFTDTSNKAWGALSTVPETSSITPSNSAVACGGVCVHDLRSNARQIPLGSLTRQCSNSARSPSRSRRSPSGRRDPRSRPRAPDRAPRRWDPRA